VKSDNLCNNVCTSSEVCVDLGAGYQCQPQECKDLVCDSSSTCINDGGVARCITAYRTEASNAVQCSELLCDTDNGEVCINDGGLARCIAYRTEASNAAVQCGELLCDTNHGEVCINDGGLARCITANAPVQCGELLCDTANGEVCINDGGLARCVQVNHCSVEASLTPRAGSYYLEGGVPHQIWDLVLTNNGTLGITQVEVRIVPVSPAQVDPINRWNLASVFSQLYNVTVYNTLDKPNSQYSGAGFVLGGVNYQATPSVDVTSVQCN